MSWAAIKTEICWSHNFSSFTCLSLPSFTSATAPFDPSNLTHQETTSILLPRYLGAKESSGPRRSPQSCPDLPQQKTKWLRYHSPLLSRLPSTCQYFHFSTISLCYVMFRFAEVLFQVLDKRESSATWPFSAVPPLRRALIHFHCCCPDWYIIRIIYIIYFIYICIFIYLYIYIFIYLCIYVFIYLFIYLYLSHLLRAYTISRFEYKVPHALMDHIESYLRNHDLPAPDAEHSRKPRADTESCLAIGFTTSTSWKVFPTQHCSFPNSHLYQKSQVVP